MSEAPLYYAKGLEVWKRPVERPGKTPGTTDSTFGFKVCECNEYVEGAAEEIAAALNHMELVTS